MPEDEDIDVAGVLEPDDDEDQTSPDADAVREFLAERKEEEKDTSEYDLEEAEKLKRQPEVEDEEDEKLEKVNESRIQFTSSGAYEDNQFAAAEQQYVNVKVDKIPVTESDKVAYVKSMLNDEPLELNISLYNGEVNIRARSVSVYEQQLAAMAAYNYLASDEAEHTGAMLVPLFLQKCRIAMQLISCNGRRISDIAYTPEPGKLSAHIADLIKQANLLLARTNAPRWNAYVYALNIFEHKLTKLDEMAINRDFIVPGG